MDKVEEEADVIGTSSLRVSLQFSTLGYTPNQGFQPHLYPPAFWSRRFTVALSIVMDLGPHRGRSLY